MERYKHQLIENKLLELFQYFPVVAVLGARQDTDFFLQNIKLPTFFDDVRYAPKLLNSIKQKVDQTKKNGMYILNGSQNLSVLK